MHESTDQFEIVSQRLSSSKTRIKTVLATRLPRVGADSETKFQ